MTARARVECDHCGLKVRLDADDIVASHQYTRTSYSASGRVSGRERVTCEYSDKPYARHMGTFFCANRPDRPWVAQCRCGALWIDSDYKVAERQWNEHVQAERAS